MGSRKFWAGVLFSSGLRMYIEDSMGLDKYKQYLDLAWTPLSPWWGVLVMVLAIVMVSLPKRAKA